MLKLPIGNRLAHCWEKWPITYIVYWEVVSIPLLFNWSLNNLVGTQGDHQQFTCSYWIFDVPSHCRMVKLRFEKQIMTTKNDLAYVAFILQYSSTDYHQIWHFAEWQSLLNSFWFLIFIPIVECWSYQIKIRLPHCWKNDWSYRIWGSGSPLLFNRPQCIWQGNTVVISDLEAVSEFSIFLPIVDW